MSNPLNGGIGNPVPNMQGIAQLQQIAQVLKSGKNIGQMITQFKRQGISPQMVEQALCMASPELAKIKREMQGMSIDDYIVKKAKETGMSPEQAKQAYQQIINGFNGGIL